jgi:uncharacterized damage-inducible protein DinB
VLDEAIRTLYRYDAWATGRLLDVAAEISADDLTANPASRERSIRDTFVHMVAAQRRWLAWWGGSASAADAQKVTLAPSDYPDIESIRAAQEETAERMRSFVDGLTDARLGERLSADASQGGWSPALWQLMLHVSTHGTQHRAEIAAMLTALDHSPGNLDMTVFYASGRD